MTQHAFWKLAEEDPSRVAVIEADGREITAGELLRASNQIVHGLRALGLGPGDTIAVMLTNEVAMLELYMAAVQAGWYMTPINSHLTSSEVAYIVGDCDAKALFCNPRTAEACVQAAKSLNFPERARFASGGSVAGFRPLGELKAGQPTSLPSDRR